MATIPPPWKCIEPGTKIKKITKYPDYRHIFMFSAITWNRHMIHYNQEQARKEGHRNVVLQRALLGNYLAQCVTGWIGEQGTLSRLEWKVRQSAFAGDELVCQGEVTQTEVDKDKSVLTCALEILNQQKNVIVTATAQVKLHADKERRRKTP
jgi:hydroxyacyl-ACP dehydratase HTD2-like protein with hotdog domain